jgi:hypothetical protein
MGTDRMLESLTAGTQKLINQHKEQSARIRALEARLAGSIADLQQASVDKEALAQENRELREQIKTIKLAQSLSAGTGDQSSKQVKTKINEYIREIDKCLSLLNRE